MAKSKHANIWKQTSVAVTTLSAGVRSIPGVLSIHAQYADPVAVVVVLVETEEAKESVRRVEEELFDGDPDFPVDLFVHDTAPMDLAKRQEALDTAYGLVWSRQ